MSEIATYLKVGTTALVIDMIEDGWLNGDYALHGSVSALRTISRDPSLRATVKLKNGRLLTALEIQGEYLDRAIQYTQSSGCDPSAETSWPDGRARSSDSSTSRSDTSSMLPRFRDYQSRQDQHQAVNAIAPGLTISMDEVDAARDTQNRQRLQAARSNAQLPQDVVGAAMFLCAAESDFITGQTLVVDGGAQMH